MGYKIEVLAVVVGDANVGQVVLITPRLVRVSEERAARHQQERKQGDARVIYTPGV